MDSVLTAVYSNWYTANGTDYPLPNGMSADLLHWVKNVAQLNPQGPFDRLNDLETRFFYNDSNSHYYFRNSNFYFHCLRNNIPFVNEDDVTTGNYVYPIEIESNTIQFILNPPADYNFASTLSSRMLSLLQSGTVKLLLVNMVDPSLETSVIKEVETYFGNLGIGKIVLLQGNVRKDINTDILQLESVLAAYQTAEEMPRYPYQTSLGYISDYVRVQDLDNTVRSKKFLSFNRFLDRSNRSGLAYLAVRYNLLEQGYFSFLCNSKDDYADRLKRLDLPEEYAEQIRAIVPYQIDTHHLPQDDLSRFFTVTNYRKDLYINSYIHIVTETQFEENASPFFSEKTFRPILNLQPFIHLGNCGSLNTLRMMGFKTFAPFINEDYDSEQDPVKRFKLAADEILRLADMSIEQVHEWYYSIKDILIHNQKTLELYRTYNPLWQLQNIS